MEYNQKFLDKLGLITPTWLRKQVAEETGEPYQTVCDALRNYRKGSRIRKDGKRVDKENIYNTTVRLMKGAGIRVPK